jgi:hypothetical protein
VLARHYNTKSEVYKNKKAHEDALQETVQELKFSGTRRRRPKTGNQNHLY